MGNITNLAFDIYNSYNYIEENKVASKPKINHYGNNQFIIQTKRALIMRENILASGMEAEDIQIATETAKNVLRR